MRLRLQALPSVLRIGAIALSAILLGCSFAQSDPGIVLVGGTRTGMEMEASRAPWKRPPRSRMSLGSPAGRGSPTGGFSSVNPRPSAARLKTSAQI